jgi:hypothetical protein
MILLVMYQLKPPGDSAAVYQTIGSFGPACHVLNSFCLISTERTPSELCNALRAKLDGQERVFVGPVTERHAEYLPKQALEWIAAQNGRERKHKVATP